MTRRDKCPTCNRPFDRPAVAAAPQPVDKTSQVPTVDQTARLLEDLRSKQADPPPADLRKHLR